MDYQIFFHVAKKNYRPTIPNSCPSLLSSLISSCWDENPEVRPSATEMLTQLEQIETDFQQNIEKWESVAIPLQPSNNPK